MPKEKLYRPNVAAVIVSSKYPKKSEVFIAERSDIRGAWQFPQGGIDKGEGVKEALLRELKEEIGTDDVEIIAKHPEWISYDFPQKVAHKMAPYSGQKQRYYLVRLRDDKSVNINTKHPEFSEYKFVKVGELFDHITYFKKVIYKQVIGYFKKEGYL
jgi:putative (di)nucleoside polyphosphate hydrolase